MKARWLFIAAIAFALGMVVVARRVRTPARPAAPITAPPESPARAVTLEDVASVTIRGDDGEKLWELKAERIEVSEDRNQTRVHRLKEGIYFSKGKPQTRFSADEVEYDAVSRKLEVRGHVMARDERGFSLQAPALTWSPQERKFVAHGSVTGLVNDLEFSTSHVQLWPDRERVLCTQPVSAKTADATMRGRRLTADLKTSRVQLVNVVASVIIRRNRSPVPPLSPAILEKKT